jgi:hypothetical protein
MSVEQQCEHTEHFALLRGNKSSSVACAVNLSYKIVPAALLVVFHKRIAAVNEFMEPCQSIS